jgi:hypothetical protein
MGFKKGKSGLISRISRGGSGLWPELNDTCQKQNAFRARFFHSQAGPIREKCKLRAGSPNFAEDRDNHEL